RMLLRPCWRVASSATRAASTTTTDAAAAADRKTPEEYQRTLWRPPTSPFVQTPQAWVSTLHSVKDERVSLVDLHPSIFRAPPRVDLLHRNLVWQQVYRNVQMTKQLNKAEMPGGGKKPWPQKKTGRAHVGSVRAPHFIRGGFANGVRGPRTWFYMLPDSIRVQGLCVALSLKLAQSDVHVVDSLSSVPEGADGQYLQEMAEARNWGYSVLFVDAGEESMTGGLLDACDSLPSFNVMPIFGLNCYSIMKYNTIVLSLPAVELLEQRLLNQIHTAGPANKKYRYIDYKNAILEQEDEREDPKFAPYV
ncbi:hypothetical protein PENTCL1PPCAC_1925, partial [Pristionchus entomophagus]